MFEISLFFFGIIVGGTIIYVSTRNRPLSARPAILRHGGTPIAALLRSHFHPLDVSNVTISERCFPFRMRADLQRTIDSHFGEEMAVLHFCGVRKEFAHQPIVMADCIIEDSLSPPVSIPPEYEQLDIGEDEPMRVLKNGLWLLESDGTRMAVLLGGQEEHLGKSGMRCQAATPNTPEGTQCGQRLFQILEKVISRAESYRGKAISLEQDIHSLTGEAVGLHVHDSRNVSRDQIILPEATLALVERNVLKFVESRARLAEMGIGTKKGVLFYGPPGTGKTLTIHYLATQLKGHTTLLVSAEDFGYLAEYMTLARLLQPSIVVMEDVDLIARDRTTMDSPDEDILLNRLLNEMDGLKEQVDILFILTTNRPEMLEAALASRPGRIGQAIEFPLPDDGGRRQLVVLYAANASISGDLVSEIVRRTEGVSAAFIQELMRRTVQFSIERNGEGSVTHEDVDNALDEMLFRGGSLNLKLLGAKESLGFQT